MVMSEETASTSNKRQKRYPLLPRGDLANKSPEENDAGDDRGEDLKSSMTTTVVTMTMNAAEGKPPRVKYLPVKSSGYGRPSTGIGMTSSVRPSTPVVIQRRGGQSSTTATADTLLPPPSPSHSVTSAPSHRCSTPQLRHGDGTVHRSSNSSNAAAISTRPRSASPAPSIGMIPRDNLHHKSRRSRTPCPNPVTKKYVANSSSALLTNQKQDLQLQQQGQHRSSPVTKERPSKYHDYSSIDADPTPVKEARRLSSIFQNRSIATTTHYTSPAIAAIAAPAMPSNTVQYNLSSPLPRTPNANNNSDASVSKSTPLSYSKALMKGLPNKGTATLSVMSENHHTHSEHSVIAVPTTSQTTILSAQLFSLSTGIDTPHIQHLISNSRKGGSNTNDKWDLRKQLEQKEADLVTLRTTLQDLLAGKEQFVDGAVAIEIKLRRELAEMKHNVQSSLTNETKFREKAANDREKLTEQVRHLEGECETHKTKCEVITSELDFAKSEVRRLNEANTEHAVALALLQSKLDRSNAERDEAVERAEGAEVVKHEAVSDGQSILELKAECNDLKSRLEVQRMVEEEICKLLDVDTSLIDSTAPDTINTDSAEDIGGGLMKMPFLDMVKQRLDEYQSYVGMKEDAESRWQSCVTELEKVKSDYQVSAG